MNSSIPVPLQHLGLATLLRWGIVIVLLGACAGVSAASASSDARAVTVAAPGAGPGASVTVSQADTLVNQTVEVTWSGFQPSSQARLSNSGDAFDTSTLRPVRVYQCRGADPASSSDCYGSPGFGGLAATGEKPAVPAVSSFTYPGQQDIHNATPDGPANWQDTVTTANGAGEVTIQLFTRRESAALGCADDVPCSLVVVPNYGDEEGSGATELSLDAPWAWAHRTVIPLHFLPLDVACPLDGASVDLEGSPVAARLLASWRAKTCTLPQGPVRLDYTAVGEPQARMDTLALSDDSGLTIEPVEKAAGAQLVYAPVALSSVVVAFQIDDADGRPVRSLRLNPRLVAKLVTASYRTGANAAVAGNPFNLFHDPEFRKLNPGVDWPDGAPGNHPLLLGDISDTTSAVSRWIAADPDAVAFIAGKPDPWGMHVNTHYKGLNLPFAQYPVLDYAQSSFFEPVQGLDILARQVSIAQFPGATTSVESGLTIISKPPRQPPGSREVIGIIDAASAADFRLSTAELRNTGGAFVGPTDAGVLAGISHSVVGADGVTRSPDLKDKNKAIYPLALQITSATSIKTSAAVRKSVSTFLDYAKGDGQIPGDEIGRLSEGYVPLPTKLRSLITAAQRVLASGVIKQGATTPTSSEPTATTAPTSPSAAPVSAPVAAPVSQQVALLNQTTEVGSQPLFQRLLTLPALLVFGLLAGVAGPGVAALRRFNLGPAWLRW